MKITTISVPLTLFTPHQMTTHVFLSPQSVAIKLYPCLRSVFPPVILVLFCFLLLLTLSPQLIINFFHTLNSPDVSEWMFSLSGLFKPGSGFTWIISHITQQRWEYEAHNSWTSSEAGQSHDPSSCASCHLCVEMMWFAGQKCMVRLLSQMLYLCNSSAQTQQGVLWRNG